MSNRIATKKEEVMTRDNAYKLLGITPNIKDEDEINRAFKKLALKHHPDKGGNEENFKKLLEAKETLLKKEEYKYELNGRKFTQSEYDQIIRDFINKSNEDLNAYEARLKEGRKAGKIRVYLCGIYLVKVLVFAAFGIGTAKTSIISLIVWGLLMYMAPLFADIHDIYLLHKNEWKSRRKK
jgi:hypothetical protein